MFCFLITQKARCVNYQFKTNIMLQKKIAVCPVLLPLIRSALFRVNPPGTGAEYLISEFLGHDLRASPTPGAVHPEAEAWAEDEPPGY